MIPKSFFLAALLVAVLFLAGCPGAAPPPAAPNGEVTQASQDIAELEAAISEIDNLTASSDIAPIDTSDLG